MSSNGTERVGSVEDGGDEENPRLAEEGFADLTGNIADDEGDARIKIRTMRHLMPLKMIRGTISVILEEWTRRERVSVKETNWE